MRIVRYITLFSKNCTFDQACRKLLAEKEKDSADKDKYKDARLSFYSVLSEPQNKKGTKTYGNHQMFNAPVGGKSLEKRLWQNI